MLLSADTLDACQAALTDTALTWMALDARAQHRISEMFHKLRDFMHPHQKSCVAGGAVEAVMCDLLGIREFHQPSDIDVFLWGPGAGVPFLRRWLCGNALGRPCTRSGATLTMEFDLFAPVQFVMRCAANLVLCARMLGMTEEAVTPAHMLFQSTDDVLRSFDLTHCMAALRWNDVTGAYEVGLFGSTLHAWRTRNTVRLFPGMPDVRIVRIVKAIRRGYTVEGDDCKAIVAHYGEMPVSSKSTPWTETIMLEDGRGRWPVLDAQLKRCATFGAALAASRDREAVDYNGSHWEYGYGAIPLDIDNGAAVFGMHYVDGNWYNLALTFEQWLSEFVGDHFVLDALDAHDRLLGAGATFPVSEGDVRIVAAAVVARILRVSRTVAWLANFHPLIMHARSMSGIPTRWELRDAVGAAVLGMPAALTNNASNTLCCVLDDPRFTQHTDDGLIVAEYACIVMTML